ncbi:MAG TPA: DNA helicase, partial [Tenericutes bacterium]|nr:DNA helicase [Mycoplasmatota bacterium]
MEKTTYVLEKNKLKEVIDLYKEAVEDYEFKLKKLPDLYKFDVNLLSNFTTQYKNKINVFKKSMMKPYFARIDFKANDENSKNEFYIGKVGLYDENNKIVTLDWRSPMASIYYDSNVGKTSYLAPEGKIEGELFLKRQYDISDGVLNSFQDVDTVSNDEILKPYLGVSADNRLKNIVATIQSEQNKIIRKKINNNLIIQG